MKRARFLLPLLLVVVIAVGIFVLYRNATAGRLADDFQTTLEPSQAYSVQEIQDAADKILHKFQANFSGCTMTQLRCSACDASSADWNRAAEYGEEEGLLFYSTFTTDDSLAPRNGFNPNDTYEYQWYLARSHGGPWKIVGYGQG